MSFHYPRRVKDLPTLELDSEDEYNTPMKPKKRDTAAAAAAIIKLENNKENESASQNLGSSSSTSLNLRKYPKRSAELPVLESDSDEEENVRNDNLNCAILNDSFILSPGRSELDENSILLRTPCEASAQKRKNGDLSFVMHFNDMALCENRQTDQKSSDGSLSSGDASASTQNPTTTHTNFGCPLKSIQENNTEGSDAMDAETHHYKQTELTQPEKEQLSKRRNIETPFSNATAPAPGTAAHAEAQFATPQIRSFSVQRRPRDLCSSQSQKTRSAIANEFRSQKVLFQTPMAISTRPPCLTNDSITLSLCDTINEMGNTPSTSEKSPSQQHTEKNRLSTGTKSKKSLESAFTEAQKLHTKKENMAVSTPATASTSTTSESSRETVLQINKADYVILQKLGCGGSSSVYLARRSDNGKECALKVVDLRGDPVVVEGYLNETKLLAKLQGNVCVVALYEYQLMRKESKLYLVMEKGDSDLHKILQSYTTNLPLYVLMNFLYQMFQAVNYIHQNGVIHSDLKPANFLMVNGRLKLIDFGIASNIAIDSTSIIKFSQAGTFNYISPEALTDTSTGTSPMRSNQPKIKISTKSDVWSLGCILYLLLYKKTPFSHIKNIYAKISAISSPTNAIEYPALQPYYPSMLTNMVKTCLQHNPKLRPSCAELLQYPFNMVIPIQNLTVPKQS